MDQPSHTSHIQDGSPSDHVCPQCGRSYDGSVRYCKNDGSMLRARNARDALIGRLFGDRYRIVRQLDRGGMGHVFLAEHVRLGRQCALKVLHPAWSCDSEARKRFHHEARHTSQISHPNIGAVHDFGETEDGFVYLAMEYIEGESLAALLRRGGTLPPKRVVAITSQVAAGLAAAHHHGIIHRDVKPENIMVTATREGLEHVRVVDFGIARVAGENADELTTSGFVDGTPAYMSPEQLTGEEVDSRTDVYSLGLVVHTMLVGRIPFPPDNSRSALAKRLTEPPLTLADLDPHVAWPVRLQEILDRALAAERRYRYPTVTLFARELETAVQLMSTRPNIRVKTREIIAVDPKAPISERAPSPEKSVAARVASVVLPAIVIALATSWLLVARSSWSISSGGVPATEVTASEAGAIALLEPVLVRPPMAAPPLPAFGTTRGLPSQHDRATPRVAPAPSSVLQPLAAISAAAALIIQDIDVAEGRARAGQYEGAWVRFSSAERRLERMTIEHPGTLVGSELRMRLDMARELARSSCRADQEMATGRGEAAPMCE